MMRKFEVCVSLVAALVLGIAVGSVAAEGYFAGHVDMLEVWHDGNVAFTLTPAATTGCQAAGQFIVKAGAVGNKNQAATLLTAKVSGTSVRVYVNGIDLSGAAAFAAPFPIAAFGAAGVGAVRPFGVSAPGNLSDAAI